MKKLLSVLSIATLALSACKTTKQRPESALNDIGAVSLENGQSYVIYEDGGKVYLRNCGEALPPLTRSCPSAEGTLWATLDSYLEALPYEVGPYKRTEDGLKLANNALEAAREAANGGNEIAERKLEALSEQVANLDKVVGIRNELTVKQTDLTYYSFHSEFNILTQPFRDLEASLVGKQQKEQQAAQAKAEIERARIGNACTVFVQTTTSGFNTPMIAKIENNTRNHQPALSEQEIREFLGPNGWSQQAAIQVRPGSSFHVGAAGYQAAYIVVYAPKECGSYFKAEDRYLKRMGESFEHEGYNVKLYSLRDVNGRWNTVINMGYPINFFRSSDDNYDRSR